MVRIGGGVFPEIKEKDFLGEGGYRVDDKAGKARVPGAAAITGLGLGSGPAAVGRTSWAMAATAWTTRPARRARQGRRCHRGRVGAAPASARMCRKACMRSTAGEARGCILGRTLAHEDGARHPGSRAAQRSRLPAPARCARRQRGPARRTWGGLRVTAGARAADSAAQQASACCNMATCMLGGGTATPAAAGSGQRHAADGRPGARRACSTA